MSQRDAFPVSAAEKSNCQQIVSPHKFLFRSFGHSAGGGEAIHALTTITIFCRSSSSSSPAICLRRRSGDRLLPTHVAPRCRTRHAPPARQSTCGPPPFINADGYRSRDAVTSSLRADGGMSANLSTISRDFSREIPEFSSLFRFSGGPAEGEAAKMASMMDLSTHNLRIDFQQRC